MAYFDFILYRPVPQCLSDFPFLWSREKLKLNNMSSNKRRQFRSSANCKDHSLFIIEPKFLYILALILRYQPPFRTVRARIAAIFEVSTFSNRYAWELSFKKKNQKKMLFLSKDIGGNRFFLVNYLNWSLTRSVIELVTWYRVRASNDTTRANCLRVVYSLYLDI